MIPHSPAERLAALPAAERQAIIAALSEDELDALLHDWDGFWARPSQVIPVEPWSLAMWMTGRGFGKTRIGSEWVRKCARRYDRIALVARTPADARDAMIEGESGILAISPDYERPNYEPSKRRLTWPNGATAIVFSGEQPEALRGPQFKKAWLDELAAYQYPEETFDNLMLALRLGDNPQALITTTPKNVPMIRRLLKDPELRLMSGETFENLANLAPQYRQRILARYEGTRRGEQELRGRLLEDTPGALWKRDDLDRLRVRQNETPQWVQIVVAIDPQASAPDLDMEAGEGPETGIVAAALGADGHGYVLADGSASGMPKEWGDAAVKLYRDLRANAIVGEVNNGGQMVGYVIGTIDPRVPFRAVWAARGKFTRAEPISALYSRGFIHHVGAFAELEDEMTTWVPGEESPNRMDALVWALWTLFLPTGEQDLSIETADEEQAAVRISPV